MENQPMTPQAGARGFGNQAPQPELPQTAEEMFSGQVEASPEEQAEYDMLVGKALKFIHGKKTREPTLKILSSAKTPAEGIGMATAQIFSQLQNNATKGGKPLSDEVMFHAATEVAEELAELGDAAGVFKFEDESEAQQQVEQGFLMALKYYGEQGLKSGAFTDQNVTTARQYMERGIMAETKGNPNVTNAIRQSMYGQPPAQAAAAQQPAAQGGGLINGAIMGQ